MAGITAATTRYLKSLRPNPSLKLFGRSVSYLTVDEAQTAVTMVISANRGNEGERFTIHEGRATKARAKAKLSRYDKRCHDEPFVLI